MRSMHNKSDKDDKAKVIIVALHGKAGMGKDIAATHLCHKYADVCNPQIMAFMDTMIEGTRMMNSLPKEVLKDDNMDRDLNELLYELSNRPGDMPPPERRLKPNWDDKIPQFAPGTTFRDLVISHADLARLQGGPTTLIRGMKRNIEVYMSLFKTSMVIIPDAKSSDECDWVQKNNGLVIHITKSRDYRPIKELSRKAVEHELEKCEPPSGVNVRVVEFDGRNFDKFTDSIIEVFTDWLPPNTLGRIW